MLTDGFLNDLKFFESLIEKKKHFCITRFGDGERFIIEHRPVRAIDFNYAGGDSWISKELKKSISFDKENYFIGIPCPCCQPKERCDYMKDLSGLPPTRITWANIFVNSNYSYFKSNIIPKFSSYDKVIFVGKGETDNLPFEVYKQFKTTMNSHINDHHLIEEISSFIEQESIENCLFVIAAGPFANVLCYKLYEKYGNNTYIDVGSTLDPMQGLGVTRNYLANGRLINKVCIW